jgi:hypothetical protein
VLAATVPSISRPLLRRIYAVSAGNPLYAIELARGLETDGRASGLTDGLPLPGSVQAAIARRLETVPPELLAVLEVVSALGPTSVGELANIVAEAPLEELLPVAEQLRLLVVDESLEVRFDHPLVGSVVYGRMSSLARLGLHARLAEQSSDPDARARHLALSTAESDAGVAALLEAAGERARLRGASDVAADFAGHALRLTPKSDPLTARRRALAEIEHLAAAGEAGRALALADELIASLPPGPERAEALIRRFYVGDDTSSSPSRFSSARSPTPTRTSSFAAACSTCSAGCAGCSAATSGRGSSVRPKRSRSPTGWATPASPCSPRDTWATCRRSSASLDPI